MNKFLFILCLLVLGEITLAQLPYYGPYNFTPATYYSIVPPPPIHHTHHANCYDLLRALPPVSFNEVNYYTNTNTKHYEDCSQYSYINCNEESFKGCYQCRGVK